MLRDITAEPVIARDPELPMVAGVAERAQLVQMLGVARVLVGLVCIALLPEVPFREPVVALVVETLEPQAVSVVVEIHNNLDRQTLAAVAVVRLGTAMPEREDRVLL
jgi:hypothetical protein